MSQRSGFDSVFIGSSGNPLINISATVLDGLNNPVTVYESKTGGAAKAQPIVTSSALPGHVSFWAEPGYYQVEITDNQIPARFATRKIPFDAVAGDTTSGSEGIDSNQIDLTNMTNRIATSMLQNDSVTSDKLRDDASTDGNRAVTTNHIRDLAISTAKLATSAVTQGKIGSSAVGLPQSKLIIDQDNRAVSASGEQIVAAIDLNPGKYLVFALPVQSGATSPLWNVRISGGAATMESSQLSLSSSYNSGFNSFLTGILIVTSATQLRLNYSSNSTATRTGELTVIGMEN